MLLSAKKLSPAMRYAVGVGLSLLALLLQIGVAAFVGNRVPFLLFISLVALAAAVLGSGPAAIVLLTGFLYGCSIFLPLGTLYVGSIRDQISLALFAVVGIFFIVVGKKVREVINRAGDAELALLNEKLTRERADDEHLRQLYQQVRSSEERYRNLFDAMDQGFSVIDVIFDDAGAAVDYKVLEMNPAGIAIYGLGDVVGKTIKEVVPHIGSYWIDTYAKVALTGQPVRFENQAQSSGRWFEGYASRVGDADSRKVALLFTDVSVRKENEARLRRLAADLSEVDRRKTEFLAVLAHELRNPLAPIRSGLDILKLSGANPQMVERMRDMMDRQVTHMVRLVDDLLDVARINGGKIDLKKERVSLHGIVSAAVEANAPMIEGARHRLHVAMPDEAIELLVDPTRLVQVLGNLLNNAAKYTPPGGRIDVSAVRDGAQIVIAVADNGVGIPQAAQPFIFDMFNQVGRNMDLSHGGLGIGLSLVKRLLEMHDGSISVASGGAHGGGTTFTLRLPLSVGDEAARPAHDRPAAAPRADMLRILVVDDNADAAQTLASLLEFKGHSIRVANDGIEALEVVQDWIPEVGLIDIGMPNLNGYELAQALRNNPALDGMALIALTGWGAENDRALSREAGFAEHLTKPVDVDAIEAVLGKLPRTPQGAV
ncbi:PAS domain-containing protein [Duganella sp. CF517]|uniref:hybrid sensor histidine kinase/response regulator n=1 Tax=Duganella sp. CF517 TaxID=1881038 RepID=UPI0008D0EDB0|nr:ATP-binding protein [Duganella sp. CF517]SEO33157.1 PAS domain-containing protein [Duganella sp. CF517]